MNKLIIEALNFERNKAYGFQEYLFNLLDYFYKYKKEVKYDEIVIACREEQKEAFSKYSDRFVIFSVPIGRSYVSRYIKLAKLPALLKLTGKDLLLNVGNYCGLIYNGPQILVIHDLLYTHPDLQNNWKFRLQHDLYVPRSVKLASRIIAISHFTAGEILSTFNNSKGKVEAVYNYMNLGKYERNEPNNDNNYFMVVSADYEHKNLITVFKAFEQYIKDGGERDLVYVGSVRKGSKMSVFLEQCGADIKGKIKIFSHVSNKELGFLYNNATAFISASKYEGFGMPIVEAMSFNLPVLLADTPVHREISLNLGDYFNSEDSVELATLMQKCYYKKDYSTIVSEKYSERSTSGRYIDIINDIYDETH